MKAAIGSSRVRFAVFALTALYIAGFGIRFFLERDEEFLSYVIVVVAALALVVLLEAWLGLPDYLLGLVSLAGFLHMAGGSVMVGGEALYAYRIVHLFSGGDAGLYVLRYDQVVHAFGFGIAALALWHVIKRHAPALPRPARAFFAIAGATGLGALNEVIEFLAVLNFAKTGVGDYYNNSLDLVFNLLGATAAAGIAWWIDARSSRR
jgi:putative membrane protein